MLMVKAEWRRKKWARDALENTYHSILGNGKTYNYQEVVQKLFLVKNSSLVNSQTSNSPVQYYTHGHGMHLKSHRVKQW